VEAFLLVEATLTVVVIAVGLVFISRGMSGSLKALSTLQHTHRLLVLAESTRSELETIAQQAPGSISLNGSFDPPNDQYQWTMQQVPAQWESSDLGAGMWSVMLTVSRANGTPPRVRLHTIWPADWIVQ